MMQEAQSKSLVLANPAKAIGQKPDLIRQLSDYRLETEGLLNSGIAILDLVAADFQIALQLQRNSALLTNDSLILAIAKRHQISNLATADSHFDSVPGLQIYKPSDLASVN